MDYRRANRAYLYMILSTIAFVAVYTIWIFRTGQDVPLIANNIISEMMILIPAIATVLYAGDRLGVVIPLKKIKLPSVLFAALYVVLLFPLVTFVNSLSMLFVDNTIAGLSGEIVMMPMWQMLLTIGLFGPFVEEIVFRGVLLQSYQRTGKIIASIILSSVLFGMMHMNFNQFAYGAVMGVMLALLYEATGTVLASFIAHAVFNTIEVIMMFANSDAIDEATELANDYIGELGGTATAIIYHAYLFLAAVMFTTLAVLIVRKISDLEGRKEFLVNIPHTRKQGYKLVTIPLIIAMVIAVAFMFFSAGII